MQVTAADVAANPGGTLLVQNITFAGTGSSAAGGGPIQAGNNPDIQTAWNTVDLLSPNSIDNGNGTGGPSFPTSGSATTSLFRDSWWYSGGSVGTLQGINGFASDGSADTIGTVTTVNSGQGVYAQGPGAAVGTTGYLFQPEATGIVGGSTSFTNMSYTGLFGPLGANFLDAAPLASQFIGGVLTVPLAQIVASGNVTIPDTYQAGIGQFIAVGGTPYNLAGGSALTDPGNGTLNYATGTITFSPEPGTFVLAGMGVLGMLLAWRRRKSS